MGIDLKFTDFETAGLLQIKNLEKRTCPAGNSNQKNCWEIHKWILKFTVHGCSSRGALELRQSSFSLCQLQLYQAARHLQDGVRGTRFGWGWWSDKGPGPLEKVFINTWVSPGVIGYDS